MIQFNLQHPKLVKLQKLVTEREYRPATFFYIPIAFYFLYLAAKAKHLLFFSNVNPFMECSDFLDTSKYDVFQKLDKELIPYTILHKQGQPINDTIDVVRQSTITYPVIVKPDLGRRGSGIQPIKNEKELTNYLTNNKGDTLIQEMIDRPMEVGVMYYRLPGQTKGTISGIMKRNFLTIKGDGTKTVYQLLLNHPRAERYMEQLQEMNKERWHDVLNKGETLKAMPLGTHSRGTQFIDISEQITKKMEERFDIIADQMGTFYFGRYDIKVHTISDLEDGPIKILEVNGAPAEPAHIYDAKYNVFEGYKEFFFHRQKIYQIGKENKKAGFPYMTLKEFYRIFCERRKNKSCKE